MTKANGGPKHPRPRSTALAKIFIAGYKSFANAAEIEIRPLTLLAGANSSGKSSIMQPLLLMKQTLEAPYDPGGLKIDGPHVKLTDIEQMFWRMGTTESTANILFGFELDDGLRVEQAFHRAESDDNGVSPESLSVRPSSGRPFTLHREMRSREISAGARESSTNPA